MPDPISSPVTLSFADGDDLALPDVQPRWHLGRLARRIECWREHQLIRKALELAGDPTLVLDLSRVTGRYWPVLAEHPSRVIIAAADSPAQFEARLQRHPPAQRERIRVLPASAFAFDLPDKSVDCVFCMRPMIGNGRRGTILRELHRVTRDAVILAARAEDLGSFQRDFTAAGFRLLGRFDFLPLVSAAQVAVLRKSN
ncbi:MAG: class I SAM-dependent methyltransferase [Zoogloeaceae bacterium]|nr:class I SAM-dependent methyltransferase [Zoogloeaceae bacterium]